MVYTGSKISNAPPIFFSKPPSLWDFCYSSPNKLKLKPKSRPAQENLGDIREVFSGRYI